MRIAKMYGGDWGSDRPCRHHRCQRTSQLRRRMLAFVGLLTILLSGCASLGIRPSEPTMGALAQLTDDCARYDKYADYVQELREAYHSRATQNRGWIYVAGITALGVAAASGGLAAAAAVGTGTLALLAISGGFAGGTFATINNSDLAVIYTEAANNLTNALKTAEMIARPASAGRDAASCRLAIFQLRESVAAASVTLESARTSNAVAALTRAKIEQEKLQALINAQITALPIPQLSPLITDVSPRNTSAGTETVITLTVSNYDLDKVAKANLQVGLGSLKIDLIEPPLKSTTGTYQYTVKFKAPATPPDKDAAGADIKKYLPVLVVAPGQLRIAPSAPDLTVSYP